MSDDIVNRFLRATRVERKYERNGMLAFTVLETRPRITLGDGWSMSIQASESYYCEPRDNHGPYTSVEVVAIHAPPDGNGGVSDLWAELYPWAEMTVDYADDGEPSDERPSGIYPRVPVDVLCALIEKHGYFIDINWEKL
jgi:hypothetical protein